MAYLQSVNAVFERKDKDLPDSCSNLELHVLGKSGRKYGHNNSHSPPHTRS